MLRTLSFSRPRPEISDRLPLVLRRPKTVWIPETMVSGILVFVCGPSEPLCNLRVRAHQVKPRWSLRAPTSKLSVLNGPSLSLVSKAGHRPCCNSRIVVATPQNSKPVNSQTLGQDRPHVTGATRHGQRHHQRADDGLLGAPRPGIGL